MATITITTDDPNTLQDVENFVTSLYQRGLDVVHVTQTDEPVVAPTEESNESPRSRSKSGT